MASFGRFQCRLLRRVQIRRDFPECKRKIADFWKNFRNCCKSADFPRKSEIFRLFAKIRLNPGISPVKSIALPDATLISTLLSLMKFKSGVSLPLLSHTVEFLLKGGSMVCTTDYFGVKFKKSWAASEVQGTLIDWTLSKIPEVIQSATLELTGHYIMTHGKRDRSTRIQWIVTRNRDNDPQ
ncbi:MAG: hypothetical protein ABW007_19400 [Chitinophagaceae bacterium]